jgi:hypothetical protein
MFDGAERVRSRPHLLKTKEAGGKEVMARIPRSVSHLMVIPGHFRYII